MCRVYLSDNDNFEFAYREFSNEVVAKAYMKGMKAHLPDIKMTLKRVA